MQFTIKYDYFYLQVVSYTFDPNSEVYQPTHVKLISSTEVLILIIVISIFSLMNICSWIKLVQNMFKYLFYNVSNYAATSKTKIKIKDKEIDSKKL